jgi:hypothetical protein
VGPLCGDGKIRRYVVEQLETSRCRSLDEPGREKHDEATAGVQRQYME